MKIFKQRFLSFALLFSMMIAWSAPLAPFAPAVLAAYSSGSSGGTSGNFIKPFTRLNTAPEGYTGVYDAVGLDNVRNDMRGNYILMNDIDLSSWGDWTPIGTRTRLEDNVFQGTIDGNGYVVSNMKIGMTPKSGTNVGLFGIIENGIVRNLGVVDIQITISDHSDAFNDRIMGGIAGRVSSTIIENCYVTGCIGPLYYSANASRTLAGGIVGIAGDNSKFADSYSKAIIDIDAEMSVKQNVGGIVGEGSNLTIERCCNSGSVQAANCTPSGFSIYNVYCGGIIGSVETSTITDCYNTGAVTAIGNTNDDKVYGYGTWLVCYAYSGGIAGKTNATPMKNVYNAGVISAWAYTYAWTSRYIEPGFAIRYGLVGDGGNVANGYSIVSGYNEGWDGSNGVTLTATQMREQASYAGFDFGTVWGIDPGINSGYPYFTANKQSGETAGQDISQNNATATPLSYVYIQTEEELAAVTGGEDSEGKCFVLVNDLSLTKALTPIRDFRGIFDGAGHTINNAGGTLFASTSGATIMNITVILAEGRSISSSQDKVTLGGLINTAVNTNIINAHFIGNVTTGPWRSQFNSHTIGGLVGTYSVSGAGSYTIERCSAIGDIKASPSTGSVATAGGLIGYIHAEAGSVRITDTYSIGDISAYAGVGGYMGNIAGALAYAGGLVGEAGTTAGGAITIANSYVAGDIETPGNGANYIGNIIGGIATSDSDVSVTNSYRPSDQTLTYAERDPGVSFAGPHPPAVVLASGTPLTPEEMLMQSSYAGWDFDTVWGIDLGINNGYPYLLTADNYLTPIEKRDIVLELYSPVPSLCITIGDSLDLGVSIYDIKADKHITDFTGIAFTVEGTSIISISSPRKAANGIYYVSIDALSAGTAYITVSDSKSGETIRAPIKVSAPPDAALDSVFTIYTVPKQNYERDYNTNFYNFNGMYIDSYEFTVNGDGSANISFDIYNSQYLYGVVEIRDENGTLKDVKLIDKAPGHATGLKDTWDSAVGLVDDIFSWTFVYYRPGDGWQSSYRQQTGFSKQSHIEIRNIPKGGYVRITIDPSESLSGGIVNAIDILAQVSGLVTGGEKLWGDIMAADALFYEKNLTSHMLSYVIKTELSNELPKIKKKLLKSIAKDVAMDEESLGDFLSTLVSVLEEMDFEEILADVMASMGFNIGERVFTHFAGLPGKVLQMLFYSDKVMNFMTQIRAFNNSLGSGYKEIQVPSDNTIQSTGVTAKTQSGFDNETALQVYQIALDPEKYGTLYNFYMDQMRDLTNGDTIDYADYMPQSDSFTQTQMNNLKELAENPIAYEINLIKDGSRLQIGEPAEISLPIPENLKEYAIFLRVFRIEEDGTVTDMACTVADNRKLLVFTTDHFSLYVIYANFDAIYAAVLSGGGASQGFADSAAAGVMDTDSADKEAMDAAAIDNKAIDIKTALIIAGAVLAAAGVLAVCIAIIVSKKKNKKPL